MSSIKTLAPGQTHPDGLNIGKATTDKIGLYGVTPVVQPAGTSGSQAAVVATAATSSTPFGYSEAQANAIVATLNGIRAALVSAGIIKGSDAA